MNICKTYNNFIAFSKYHLMKTPRVIASKIVDFELINY